MVINFSSNTNRLNYEQYVTRAAKKYVVGLLQYVAGAATGTEAVKLLGYELATDNKLHAFLLFLSS